MTAITGQCSTRPLSGTPENGPGPLAIDNSTMDNPPAVMAEPQFVGSVATWVRGVTRQGQEEG
jgi:hypothetical protein